MNASTELPRIASREEWLAARLELLRKEKELTRARDALSAERRRLPMVKIEKDYRFQTPHGVRDLAGLFEGQTQLVVHHFMWIDDADEGCKGCSMQVDTIGDLPVHLRQIIIERDQIADDRAMHRFQKEIVLVTFQLLMERIEHPLIHAVFQFKESP